MVSMSSADTSSFSLLCQKEILYHGMLCIMAIAVVVAQATLLNFYIIAFFRGNTHHVATYFWFLGDLFIVCLFAISFTTAYRYIHQRRKLESHGVYSELQIQHRLRRSIYKHVMWLSPDYCGTLPFSFLSWGAYSVYLVCKIGVIFSSQIPAFMTDFEGTQSREGNSFLGAHTGDPVHGLGSNLLKVTIGLSALVFIIMLQAHHNHDTDSPHSGYISGVCHNTAVEVFDSVTLLALLVVADKESHFSKIWNFDKLIIVLSSLNLMLPTVALYMLSMSDFGRHLDKVTGIKVVYQALLLLFINVPFLGVRIYLWAAFNYELSLFVVKNLCYIFMLCHSLYPGVVRLLSRLNCRSRGSSRRSSSKLSSSRAGFLPSSSSPPPPQLQQRHPRPASAASSSLQFDHIEMDHAANYGGTGEEKGEHDVASRRNTTATVEEEKSLDETQTVEI